MSETIIECLCQDLQDIDFCDIFYSTFPAKGFGDGFSMDKSKNKQSLKKAGAYPVYATSQRASMFFSDVQSLLFVRNVSLMDFINNGVWPKDFIQEPLEKDDGYFKAAKANLMHKYGYLSLCVLFVELTTDDFIGCFSLVSSLEQDELEQRIAGFPTKTLLRLTHYHLSRRFPSDINPNIFDGKIKNKTLKTIRLLSSGCSIKEIAEKLCLTERGVAYHLERAKLLLGANNKAELIRLAKEACIL